MSEKTSSTQPLLLKSDPTARALPKKAAFAGVIVVLSMITAVLTAVTIQDQGPATRSIDSLVSTHGDPSLYREAEAEPFANFLNDHLRDLVAEFTSNPMEQERLQNEIQAVYDKRAYRLAWTGGNSPILHRARSFRALLNKTHLHGLDSRLYQADSLAQDIKSFEINRNPEPADHFGLESRLTIALLSFTRDLHGGRVESVDLPDWHKDPAPVDVVTLVSQALESEDRRQLVNRLEPTHLPYRRLAAKVSDYQRIVDQGGWPTLPEGDTLELGDPLTPEVYQALVDRLLAEGDLSAWPSPAVEDATNLRFDAHLSRAVGAFQARHGLAVDGKLGQKTRAAMNVSAGERLSQIEANLERWRWLPLELPADRIEVNVPSFELRGYRNGSVAVEMAVAVGKPDWATPIFEGEVLYAKVNPYWNVPASIAADEVLPQVRKDPTYLEKENMEVVPGWSADQDSLDLADLDWNDPGTYGADYRIRQRPGAGNALGQIKFIFPNSHDVYLHDTPAQRAFERPDRAVSHGCVRVAEPLKLADFLFAGESFIEVKKGLAGAQPQQINLEQPMPVMLHYWTAFVDDQGRMSFRDDLYGIDGEVGELLVEVSTQESETRLPTQLEGQGQGQAVVTSAP